MNPDKLFDYLDGKLSPEERAALEERFMSEPELRKELAVARQIHAQIGDSREIVGFAGPTLEQRGAVLARRVAVVFTVLVFANVIFGIYAIAFMKKKERAKVSAEQNRSDLTESLARTAAVALPTPTLELEEIKFTAPIAEQNQLANAIVDEAKAVGGSAAKGLTDQSGVLLFAEIPTPGLKEFRDGLRRLGGNVPVPPAQNVSGEKNILQIRITSGMQQ